MCRKDVLKGCRREVFSRMAKAQSGGGRWRANPKRQAAASFRVGRVRPTKPSAWGEYQRVHWTAGVPAIGAAAVAERDRLRAIFTNLTIEQVRQYETLATSRLERTRDQVATLNERFVGERETLAPIAPGGLLDNEL
jgi:hypothetical protein